MWDFLRDIDEFCPWSNICEKKVSFEMDILSLNCKTSDFFLFLLFLLSVSSRTEAKLGTEFESMEILSDGQEFFIFATDDLEMNEIIFTILIN
jgi:hypothetical protein